MMEADWRPTGWLGIVLAGALWTPLQDDSFVEDIGQVVVQIRQAVPNAGAGFDLGMSRGDLKDELARLRADVAGENEQKGEFKIDYDAPAVLDAGVPVLPVDLRETECIRWVRDVLLQNGDPTQCAKTRVGFWCVSSGSHRYGCVFTQSSTEEYCGWLGEWVV